MIVYQIVVSENGRESPQLICVAPEGLSVCSKTYKTGFAQ